MEAASLVARRSSLSPSHSHRRAKRLSVYLVAAHLLGLVSGCFGDDAPTRPGRGRLTTAVARAADDAAPLPVGEACVTDDECGADKACFGDPGYCECRPNLTLCGRSCVDLGTSEDDCGACGEQCSRGEVCEAGLCGGIGLQLAQVDVPVQVVGGTPSQSCVLNTFEFSPERPMNVGDAFMFGGHNPTNYNWGSAWNVWNASMLTPAVAAGRSLGGDAWATTSSGTALQYISQILRASNPTRYCIGIGATSADNIDNNVWTYPVACANPLDADLDDGPAIFFDPGAPRLWAVANELVPPAGTKACDDEDPGDPDPPLGSSAICLYIFNNCGAGQPGGAQCPVTSTVFVDADFLVHTTVTVNPATHHGIVAYRSGGGEEEIRLKFYDANGVLIKSWVLRSGQAFNTTDDCINQGCTANGAIPRCAGKCSADCTQSENGCHRVISRVHVATKGDPVSGRTFAYVAYDVLCGPGPDGGNHFKARLDIVDITDEQNPFIAKAWISSDCSSSAANDFHSISTANEFLPNVGRFYYRQREGYFGVNPCDTIFTGGVDANLGLVNLTSVGTISGPFPTIRFNSVDGMGHYIGIVRRGLPGGYLFPTWSQPITTAAQCVDCAGDDYSLSVLGTRVLP